MQAADTSERGLWKLAAVRLYAESLNTMFDSGSSREAAFRHGIPDAVVYLQLGGAALALGVLGLYLAHSGAACTRHC